MLRRLTRLPRWAGRLSAAIFILALIVRLVPGGLYVTPDEPIWVLRSVQTLDALRAGTPAAIPQTGHPGLTTMVVGAVGVWLTTLVSPMTSAAHLDWIRRIAWLAPENAAAFGPLAYFLPAGRLLVAVTTSAGLVLAYRLGRRRMGEPAARLLALWLALDPFFAGHAGLLHTDALQATFLLLAVILTLPVAQGQRTEMTGYRLPGLTWAAAALCLALAGLTKSLGLAAAPGLALAVLVWGKGDWRQRTLQVTVLAGLTVGLLLALYPPLWMGPRAALQSLLEAVTYHEGIGLRPVFFAGALRTDPGPAFYPLVLLFRLTPPVMLGLLMWVVGRRRPAESATVGLVLVPAVGYLAILTLATKKLDRYVLTAVPLLTLMAALWWQHCRHRWRLGLSAVVALSWALVALVPLQYATPLMGGGWIAQHLIPLGWGEAWGLAARRLNHVPSTAAPATVMTRNVPETAARFQGDSWPWDEAQMGCTAALIDVGREAPDGYAVLEEIHVGGRYQATLFVRQIQARTAPRVLAPGLLPGVPETAVPPPASLTELEAWLVRRFGDGEPFVRLLAPHCFPLTEAQIAAVLDPDRDAGRLSCQPVAPVLGLPAERCRWSVPSVTASPSLARFGGAVDLVAAAWEESIRAPSALRVRLRWQPQVALSTLEAYLTLQAAGDPVGLVRAEGGRHLISRWGWPAEAWPAGQIIDADAYVLIPLDLPPGLYHLNLSLLGDGRWLGLTHPDGAFGGTELTLGTLEVQPPPYPAPQLDLAHSVDVAWSGLRVIGAALSAETLWSGQRLGLSLGAERTPGSPPAGLAWELVCEGDVRDGGLLAWSPSDPADWHMGHRYVLRYAPRVDANLSEGRCTAVVRPPTGQDGAAYPEVILGEVLIRQRPRIYQLPRAPDVALTAVAHNVARLDGVDLPSPYLRPGEALNVTLYWRSLGTVDTDYTVFVHVVGPDSTIWAQSDAVPGGGQAPTVTWTPDEVIVDVHRLTLAEDAPPGRYEVYAGLYDARRGLRLSFHAEGTRLPDDQVPLGTVSVMH